MSIKHTSVASLFSSKFSGTPLCRGQHFTTLHLRIELLAMFIILSVIHVSAQTKDSTSYHLFNPVPREQMRTFSIDRPDVTESPNTVDAGHFQFEGDLVKWVGENQGKGASTISYLNGLYKMGLTKSWDIHVGIELYNVYQDSEGKTLDKGYGSTTIRLKHNFWGNDGDKRTALGIIPYVTFPSSTQGDYQTYGVGFPFSYSISDNYGAGAQFQFDFLPDEKGNYDLAYLQTFVIGGPLAGNLDFYVEAFGYFQQDTNFYFANGGLIYNIGDNVKIDVATNLGLTDETPTRVYAGLSFRI